MFCASDPNIVVMGGPNSNRYNFDYDFRSISSMFRSQDRIKKIEKIFNGKIQKKEVRF